MDAQTLDALLANLHSEKSQLVFLNGIYTPGNVEVADRILAMHRDSSVIEKEIEHARKNGELERFRDLARKYVKHNISMGAGILLKDVVIGWQDPVVADYAVTQMTSETMPMKTVEYLLPYAADIAQAFGNNEVAKASLERLLSLQIEDDLDVTSVSAATRVSDTLKRLGRFDNAIDRLMRANLPMSAFELAEEHSPQRLKEIAEVGFAKYTPAPISGQTEFYAKCARVIGKEDEARSALVPYANKLEPNDSPGVYQGIVKGLVLLGEEETARELVRKVEHHESYEKDGVRHYQFDRSDGMAELYHAIGDIDAVSKVYAARIDTAIKQRHNASDLAQTIQKAVRLTGRKMPFLDQLLVLHESQGAYEHAAIVAEDMGRHELAESYMIMHRMTCAAKAPKSA
jgi:tetratricopeptide (TPR) repeat protein